MYFFVNEINVMDLNDFVYFFPQLHNADTRHISWNKDFHRSVDIYSDLYSQRKFSVKNTFCTRSSCQITT